MHDDVLPEGRSVEVEQVGDRCRAGAIVEEFDASAQHCPSAGWGRIREAEAWSEVSRHVVEVVLVVVTQTERDRKITAKSDGIFKDAAEGGLPEDDTRLAPLRDEERGRIALVARQAVEGVRAHELVLWT